ncbi:MAG TPA: 30S ribosomal protein S5 [Candidatus Nanoarchaeia archaeon]|nr:30S ribosomal protein S5 [Candidatus Nanoarchaeia archaeon]
MAEELIIEEKKLIEEIETVPEIKGDWKPVTELGRMVKEGRIVDIGVIFSGNYKIKEAQIVDVLLPNLEEDLLLIGQAKGKFGGGQRRIFRQTQKKTREGNRFQFMTCAVVGNRNGYVGIGTGKSKETVPARDKAKRKARLNLIKIRRGAGSWESDSMEPTSIPFAVTGKCGSVRLTLMPAPRGTGLCVEKECAKVLALAGIKDVWSKTEGQTKTKLNLIWALIDALKKLSETKVPSRDAVKVGLVEGKLKSEVKEIKEAKEVMGEVTAAMVK